MNINNFNNAPAPSDEQYLEVQQSSQQLNNIDTNMDNLNLNENTSFQTSISTYKVCIATTINECKNSKKTPPSDKLFISFCNNDNPNQACEYLASLFKNIPYKHMRPWLLDRTINAETGLARKTPLEIAAKYNNLECCQKIIKYVPPRTRYESDITTYTLIHEIKNCEVAFAAACKASNLDVVKYLYFYFINTLNRGMNFDAGLYLIVDSLPKVSDIKILEFLLDKLKLKLREEKKAREDVPLLFLLIEDPSETWLYHLIINCLLLWHQSDNWSCISCLLKININYAVLLILILKKKKFTIATEIIKNFTAEMLYNKEASHDKKTTILNYIARKMDSETMAWLLTSSKNLPLLSLEEQADISTLDYAILADNYNVAVMLLTQGFKTTIDKSNFELEDFNKIQDFLSKIPSLSSLSAITLGLKYVKNKIPIGKIKEEIAFFNPRQANKVTKKEQVFLLN